MKKHTYKEKLSGKKLRVKGKILSTCYFEDCIIINDRYTIFYNCYFANCSFAFNDIPETNIIIYS